MLRPLGTLRLSSPTTFHRLRLAGTTVVEDPTDGGGRHGTEPDVIEYHLVAELAGVEGFTPHSLRHYAASVLIDQGASVKAVQRHLGHGSATTTLDTYAHLWPDSDDVTRRALGAGVTFLDARHVALAPADSV